MLKINTIPTNENFRIYLPEKWHDKLVTFVKNSEYPYNFILTRIYKDNTSRETYYICEGEKNKKIKIAFSEYVIKYYFATEVPDSNIGFSFKEFLPLEDSKLLITNIRNPNIVEPSNFTLYVGSLELDGSSITTLSFRLENINGNGLSTVRYYTDGSKKSTWKFIFNDDESYMTEYEKTFKDTIVHKIYVQKSSDILCRYLEKEKAFEHSKLLRERARIHDNSKISNLDELYALSRIIDDKSSLKNVNNQLSTLKKDAIALHWKHNAHHPEHFSSVLDMSKLDIMEMCCDWHARSSQFHTNFLEYVQVQQEKRFHFPEWMFAEIWHYCQVLAAEI